MAGEPDWKPAETLALSELRPCDCCGGALVPLFHVVDASLGVVNSREGNQVLGMAQAMGGALGIAEALAPAKPVKISHRLHRLYLCSPCFALPGSVLEALEKAE